MGLLQDVKASYSFLKLNEIRNRYTYAKKDKIMAEALERYKLCPNKKSPKRISYEMKALKKYWNCYPFEYIKYDFYRDDNDLSLEELKDFIPEYFFYRLFLPYHTKAQYVILTKDKILLEGYFSGLGIKQPYAIAKIYGKKIYDGKFQEISVSDVLEKVCEYDDIFIKPPGNNGGHGIQVFSKKNNKFVSDKGIELNDKSLLNIMESGNWILQAGIKQADSVSELYPYSINTFRIVTENMNGSPRIVYAELRMGRGGMRLDNVSQGGILAMIDVETGKLLGGAMSSENEIFESHPDTGFKFAHFQNKNWEQIKDFVKISAGKIPQMAYIGWDIALTDKGPIAIEINHGFGIDGVQPQISLRKLFNITDPAFYWKNQRKNI